MAPHTQQEPRQEERQPTQSSPASSSPTVNQRMGFGVISLVFIVMAANIMAYLSPSFGPIGSGIGLAAICAAVLGLNIAFNLDMFRPRR